MAPISKCILIFCLLLFCDGVGIKRRLKESDPQTSGSAAELDGSTVLSGATSSGDAGHRKEESGGGLSEVNRPNMLEHKAHCLTF